MNEPWTIRKEPANSMNKYLTCGQSLTTAAAFKRSTATWLDDESRQRACDRYP